MTRQLSLLVLCCVVGASFFVVRMTQGEVRQEDLSYEAIYEIRRLDAGRHPMELQASGTIIKYYGELSGIEAGDRVLVRGKSVDVRDEQRRYYSSGYSKYLLSKGIFQIVYAKEILPVEKGFDLYTIRQRSVDSFQANLDSMYGKQSPMIKALIYGDRSELSEELMEDFSKTGTTHILALSGFHIGILALMVNILLTKASVHRRGAIICAVLAFYSFLTGMKPSILRASLFFGIYYLAFYRHERYNLFAASCMTASVLLVWNPYYIYDVGFIFSFMSVISIALFFPMLRGRLNGFRYIDNFFVQAALMSVAAQVLTVPLSVYCFGRLSYVSVLANLFVIPIVSLMMGMSVVSLGVHYLTRRLPIFYLLEKGLVGSVKLLQGLLLYTNHFLAELPHAYTDSLRIDWKGLAAVYVLLIGLYLLWEIHQIRENQYEPKRNLEILIRE